MNKIKLTLFTTTLLFAGFANAAVTVYTDKPSWDAAVSGVVFTEDFTDANLECGLSYTSTVGVIDTGKFRDRVTQSSGETSTFSWSLPVDAVGGIWDLSPGGPGHGLALNAEIHTGGNVFIYEIPNTTVGAFIGFTSDDPIDSLTISAGSVYANAETYNLDNLTWAEASKTVSVNGCDTGIANRLVNGCSLDHDINNLTKGCEFDINNHGDYVSCVSKATNILKSGGIITGAEKGAITSCAARSDVGKPD